MSVNMRCACLILVFTVYVLTVVQCQDSLVHVVDAEEQKKNLTKSKTSAISTRKLEETIQDSETRPCQLENDKSGICKPLKDCPSAIEALKKSEPPINCSFNRDGPVVCCGVSENLAISKSETNCMELHRRREKKSSDDTHKHDVFAIVGGVEALSRQFKHMAILGYGDENETAWACGGSLISEKFVLTAAHCANTKELGEVKFVRVGDLNIKDKGDDAEPQDFNVTRRIRHPQYKPPSQYHDIALLELDRPVKISAYVKPACIHTSRKIDDPVWIATGWGRLQFAGESADHLQRVNLREFTIDECNKYYTANRRLVNGITDSSQICAGDQNKDTCQGDSGGPLQIRNPDYGGSYRIIGVTSFGKACGVSTSPGIYTRVSNYVDWIESIVWPNE